MVQLRPFSSKSYQLIVPTLFPLSMSNDTPDDTPNYLYQASNCGQTQQDCPCDHETYRGHAGADEKCEATGNGETLWVNDQ